MAKRVILLGGGPTNLATADRLLNAGRYEVEIVERLPWTGGLSKSFTHGLYTLDLGPHRFTPHTDEVYEYVRSLCGEDLQIIPQKVEIYLDRHFFTYPFRISELLVRFPLKKSAQIFVTFLAASLSSSKSHAKSYEEWIMKRFGKEITGLVFRPLVEKVWGTPLSQLSARFAYQRIAISSLWEILWEMLRGKRKAEFSCPYYPQNHFLYPQKGFGSIVDKMTERILKKGGKIHLEAQVEKIIVDGYRAVSIEAKSQSHTLKLQADWVISSLPINLLPQMITPEITSPSVLSACKSLRFRSLILLYLVIKKDRVSFNTSFYFPHSQFPFGRASEMKNHSPSLIPSDSKEPKTVFTLEIPCWREEALWNATDENLFNQCIAPLKHCGLIRREEVVEYFTVRLRYVYPVWDISFEDNMSAILDYVNPIENLILNGRPGLFFYNNIHQSLEMGFIAAEHILSNKPKKEKWLLDSEKFKEYHLIE